MIVRNFMSDETVFTKKTCKSPTVLDVTFSNTLLYNFCSFVMTKWFCSITKAYQYKKMTVYLGGNESNMEPWNFRDIS